MSWARHALKKALVKSNLEQMCKHAMHIFNLIKQCICIIRSFSNLLRQDGV